jgi:hypothetical protein
LILEELFPLVKNLKAMKTKTILVITLVFYTIIVFSFSNAAEKYSQMEIDYTIKDVSCYNKTDGRIDIQIRGGKAPYIIVWDNGISALSLENLRAGEYSVKVCDARGKMVTQYFCIDSPKQLNFNLTAELNNQLDFINSKSNIQVEGGTPWEVENQPYYFFRLNGSANYDDSLTIESGVYNFSIEDSKGCKMEREVYLQNGNSGTSTITNKQLPVLRIRRNDLLRQMAFSDLH